MADKNRQIQRSSSTIDVSIDNLTIQKCLSEPPILKIAGNEGGIGRIAKLIYPQMDLMIRSLGCKMDNELTVMLCIDFLEKFSYETIPDILMVIEAGRKDMYPGKKQEGKVYGTVTMPILSYWMKCHLEKKYNFKDNLYTKEKKLLKGENKVVFNSRQEYLDWVENGLKQQDEIEKANGKSRKQKFSKTLDRLVELSVSIGKTRKVGK